MVSHPISNLWILVLCLCFVLSRICLLSCSIFRFASLNSPFSFIFLFTERIIKSFNYFTYFRSNFCLFLLILLKLLCISSVTLLVLLNLCIVSFFVVVPFCFFQRFQQNNFISLKCYLRGFVDVVYSKTTFCLVLTDSVGVVTIWGIAAES